MVQDDCWSNSYCIHIPESRKGKRHNTIQNKIGVVFLRKKARTGMKWQLVVSAIDLASGCRDAVTGIMFFIYEYYV